MPDEQPVHQFGRRGVSDEAEVQDEFGRALVELVRDPVVGAFLHGEAVPADEGGVQHTMLALVPRVVQATVDLWVESARTGAFPLQAWENGVWVEAPVDRASEVLARVLTQAADVPGRIADFSRPEGPPPPAMPAVCVPRRWREALASAELSGALQLSAPDIVDEVVAAVLDALDDGRVRLRFWAAGEWVDLSCPEGIGGEFLGWYYGDEGWLDRFAHEVVHPIADFSGLTAALGLPPNGSPSEEAPRGPVTGT